VEKPDALVREIPGVLARDFEVLSGRAEPAVLHRKAGARDIYLVYGVPKGTECFFRTTGAPELWDPWDGTRRPLAASAADGRGTRLRMPLTEREPQLIVFSPGRAVIESPRLPARPEPDTLHLDGEWGFELKPTLDNRWGDYRLPAFGSLIGAEASTMRYADETAPGVAWYAPGLDDSAWARVSVSYGPGFWKLGPLGEGAEKASLDSALAALRSVDPSVPVEFGGRKYHWAPHEFSWRWGLKDNPGHQGYHGLKGIVHDDIIGFGRAVWNWPGIPGPHYEADTGGSSYYLWSSVPAEDACRAEVLTGSLRPESVWLNGRPLGGGITAVDLKAGSNPLLLSYRGVGSGYYVLRRTGSVAWRQTVPLSSRWYGDPAVLRFDLRPGPGSRAGWYRFAAPPGLRSLLVAARGSPRVFIDGAEASLAAEAASAGRIPDPDLRVWRAEPARPAVRSSVVAIRIEQERGYYGGAAIEEPVAFSCGEGLIGLGDLSKNEALRTYSGGMWYRKNVRLTEAQCAPAHVVLDLGDLVASAEVWVNGSVAGRRLTPPWVFDLAGKVRPGENRVEVLVYNTLGNLYLTAPSRYRGSAASGLFGPVRLILF
jgi:hypothetical protein